MKRRHGDRPSPVCNDHVFQQLSLVNDCADALHKLGHHIIGIRLGGHRAVIEIEDTGKPLNGGMYMRETQHGQTLATYAAQLYGCSVRWKGQLPAPSPDHGQEVTA